MSHFESVKCNHCVNGFVMTGMGPKPCMYCHGKGHILLEIEDEEDYSSTNEPNYSDSSYSDSYDDDDKPNSSSRSNVRLMGCIVTVVIFFVVVKYALIPADWGKIGPYIAVLILLFVGTKLSFR